MASPVDVESKQPNNLLWWLIPDALAGMPMPFIHPERRMAGGSELYAFDDELVKLFSAGVRAVVSLLNIPSDAPVYSLAGFQFLCLPIDDGSAPTLQQADQFVRFVNEQQSSRKPVAVHCAAGLGRTGTMLALYLIAGGESARTAIGRVRRVEPAAIETARQIAFLEMYERELRRAQ